MPIDAETILAAVPELSDTTAALFRSVANRLKASDRVGAVRELTILSGDETEEIADLADAALDALEAPADRSTWTDSLVGGELRVVLDTPEAED